MAPKIDLKVELRNYFGFDKFKGNQEAIIENLLAGNDTFGVKRRYLIGDGAYGERGSGHFADHTGIGNADSDSSRYLIQRACRH